MRLKIKDVTTAMLNDVVQERGKELPPPSNLENQSHHYFIGSLIKTTSLPVFQTTLAKLAMR